MKKKLLMTLGMFMISTSLIMGCGASEREESSGKNTEETTTSSEEVEEDEIEVNEVETSEGSVIDLEDGIYSVDFDTDSSMFHVNETCDGKGTLTVKEGEAILHITLASKNIVNLYPGLAEEAKKDGAVLLEPTTDTVTYEDGMSEEVYGFDVPVTAMDQEFDLALIGTKGKWYDHKVKILNPEKVE